MRTKVCGIQSIDEALLCLDSGASAVGFLVGITHKAEDKITADLCKNIVSAMPPFIITVMVTHLTISSEIIELAAYIGVNTLQLHDDLPMGDIVEIRKALPYLKVIKAVHVTDEKDACIRKSVYDSRCVDAILLDSRTADRLGGTGKTHDWSISAAIRQAISKPLILAGGLNPDNVQEAIRIVRPYAVDVNSGVEDISGKKDPGKVRSFVENAISAI